jgi:hypothetical protein
VAAIANGALAPAWVVMPSAVVSRDAMVSSRLEAGPS